MPRHATPPHLLPRRPPSPPLLNVSAHGLPLHPLLLSFNADHLLCDHLLVSTFTSCLATSIISKEEEEAPPLMGLVNVNAQPHYPQRHGCRRGKPSVVPVPDVVVDEQALTELGECCQELEEGQRVWVAHRQEAAWWLKRVEQQLEMEH
ncbi:uncharacterized protein LOC133906799 [Phragmites australis]|uniref:uncharacterized protein LOC133906799 n=1 Tax=Phragmites australis TaxID=29695 RepID=UPI002D797BF4|nr:uncharacterized protein LOC133906799 [Phragmites australis]